MWQIDDERHWQNIGQKRTHPGTRHPDEIGLHLSQELVDSRAGDAQVSAHQVQRQAISYASQQPSTQAHGVHSAGQLMDATDTEIAS